MIDLDSIRKAAYYTATETAGILDISRMTLRRRMVAGDITPSIDRRNGRIYYRGAEIIRFALASVGCDVNGRPLKREEAAV